MNLLLTAKSTDGRLIPLPPPLSLRYQEDRYVPAASLEVTLPLAAEGAVYCGLTASLDGAPLFEGIVDRQTEEKSSSGRLLKLECRAQTALLLDNEVKPYVYFQLTSSQVFERYAAPCGVLRMELPYEAKKNYLSVKKGWSHWELIEQFCMLTYRKKPFVDRTRTLRLDPLTGRTLLLSNRLAGGAAYTRVTTRLKNDKVISRLYMKTATEPYGYYYGVVFDNPEAARRKIRRERYYHPQNDVTENKKDETLEILNRSNRDGFEAEVEAPGLLPAAPGDRVRLPDEPLQKPLVVRGLSYEIDAAGLRTRLTLVENRE